MHRREKSRSSDPTQQLPRPPISTLAQRSHSHPPVAIRPASYFNFTKSKTKIAHTPTVIGNCTSTASRIGVPLGSTKVRPNIAKAVTIPSANLVVEFIVVYLANLATSIILAKSGKCNSSRRSPIRPVGFIRREVVSQMALATRFRIVWWIITSNCYRLSSIHEQLKVGSANQRHPSHQQRFFSAEI